MMALRLMPILQVTAILCTVSGVPIYGTKRYGQSYHLAPYRTMIRNTRYPINYYEPYPSSSNYADEYYAQDGAFPFYYPRTSKYEVYQAVLPYYYQERPVGRYGYNYYAYDDPVGDLQEEMMQEEAIKEREAAQPIGHEVMYESDYEEPQEDTDDTKVAFLQNLILTQMYNDKQREQEQEQERERAYYESLGYIQNQDHEDYTDKDVDDLKELAKHQNQNQNQHKHKANRKQKQEDRMPNWYKNQHDRYSNEAKRGSVNNNNKQAEIKDGQIHSERKPILKIGTTTTEKPTTHQPLQRGEGQKEIVMMRPATPVRNPFSNTVLQMMSKEDDRKRSPSVYETIKKMLDMEKSLEQQNQLEGLRPNNMKKRIVASEESLINQLTVLKKTH